MKRFLDLKERECAGLDVMKLGSVRHGALEKIYNELQQDGILHWGRIDLDRADALIDEHLAEMRREELKRALRAGRMQELTLETLATDLKLAVRAMRLAAQNGEVAQCSAEWQFGRDGELTVEVDGLNIAITGKVDRIDCCRDASGRAAFFLYDYKSGKRMFSLTRLFGGVDMQLFSYALALLATAGERRPSAIADRPRLGGVFYWPLTAPLLDGEADADAGDEVVVAAWFEKCRPFGIFATDLAERLDASITPGGPGSPAWRFKLTNKGELNRSCTSIWEPAKLEMLLERHRLLQEKMLHAIASGEIAPHPYRIGASTGCDFCGLAALCRRDSTPSFHYRRILPIKRKGAYELFDQFGPEGLL